MALVHTSSKSGKGTCPRASRQSFVLGSSAFDRKPHLQGHSGRCNQIQSLGTNEIDLYLGVLPDQIEEAPKYEAGLSQNYSFLRLSNLEGSSIRDPRIRQAMNYAIDKDGLRNALHGGLGNNLNAQLSVPEMTGYNPNLQPYPYDPERALDLIREAGAHGLDVTIEGPKGRYTGDAVEMQAIGAMLESVGLHIDLVLRDPNSWVRMATGTKRPYLPKLGTCAIPIPPSTLIGRFRPTTR